MFSSGLGTGCLSGKGVPVGDKARGLLRPVPSSVNVLLRRSECSGERRKGALSGGLLSGTQRLPNSVWGFKRESEGQGI